MYQTSFFGYDGNYSLMMLTLHPFLSFCIDRIIFVLFNVIHYIITYTDSVYFFNILIFVLILGIFLALIFPFSQ